MDESTKASYEQKSKQLRADLKKWESDWASSHDGAKPSRQDIKDNPSIGMREIKGIHGVGIDFCSCKIQRIQQDPRCPLWQGTADEAVTTEPQEATSRSAVGRNATQEK